MKFDVYREMAKAELKGRIGSDGKRAFLLCFQELESLHRL